MRREEDDDGLTTLLWVVGGLAGAAFVALILIVAAGCVGPANAPSPTDYFPCGETQCRVRDEECSTGLPRRCIPAWSGAAPRDAGR